MENCSINYISFGSKGLLPTMFPGAPQKCSQFICGDKYFTTKNILRIKVPAVHYAKIKSFLTEYQQRKQDSITHLFFFIAYANFMNTGQVLKEELAAALGLKYIETITEYTHILEDHGLIVSSFEIKEDGHRYNSYSAINELHGIPPEKRLISIDYKVSQKLWGRLERNHIQDQCVAPQTLKAISKSKSCTSAQVATVAPISQSKQQSVSHSNIQPTVTKISRDDFEEMFLKRYSTLMFKGERLSSMPRYSADGRIYHVFHGIPKSERYQILWDGEQIVEAWDAHNAFYVFMYADLLSKGYGKDRSIKEFGDWVFSGRLYEDVAEYIEEKTRLSIRRNLSKELVQTYKNITRGKLFNKFGRYKYENIDYYTTPYRTEQDLIDDLESGRISTDSPNKKVKNAANAIKRHLVIYVDKLFLERFRTVRDFIIDYETRTDKGQTKSNIQRDITQWETRIISYGICRYLYEQSGIECITLHDAIYVKQSQLSAIKNIDINAMFRKEVESYRTLDCCESVPLF